MNRWKVRREKRREMDENEKEWVGKEKAYIGRLRLPVTRQQWARFLGLGLFYSTIVVPFCLHVALPLQANANLNYVPSLPSSSLSYSYY